MNVISWCPWLCVQQRKVRCRTACYFICHTSSMTRSVWCRTMRTSKMWLRTSCHWHPFTTCAATTRRPSTSTSAFCSIIGQLLDCCWTVCLWITWIINLSSIYTFHHVTDPCCVTLCYIRFESTKVHARTHTHTHTRLTALYPGLPGWAGTRKVKPIWILLKQETVSGSGINWAICKSAHRSREITMPAPHHSVFTGRMPFLPPNQQCQNTEGCCQSTEECTKVISWYFKQHQNFKDPKFY